MKGHPAWYGSVMGTGALALALSVQSLTWQADWLRWGAQGFLVVASVLAIVLLPPYAARLRSREALTGELPDWDATDCPGVRPACIYEGEPRPEVLERYAAVQAAAYN